MSTGCFPHAPLLGIKPTAPTCVSARKQPATFPHRTTPNALSHTGQGWKHHFCLGFWAARINGTTRYELLKLAGVLSLSTFPGQQLFKRMEQVSRDFQLIIFPHCSQMVRQSHPLPLGAVCKHPALNHSDNLVSLFVMCCLPSPPSASQLLSGVPTHTQKHVIGEEMLVLQYGNKKAFPAT